MQRSGLCRSRRELSNAYLLAKIGVDAAENEPLEVWGENSIQYSLHSLELPHEVVVVDVHSAGEDDESNGNASAHNADEADIAVVFPALLLFSDASVVRHVDEHDALDVLGKPGGSVRGERANFTRLVLGCIEAKFCK